MFGSMEKIHRSGDQGKADGSALANRGRMGDGDILRDKDDQLLMDIATTLCEGMKNKPEIEDLFLV